LGWGAQGRREILSIPFSGMKGFLSNERTDTCGSKGRQGGMTTIFVYESIFFGIEVVGCRVNGNQTGGRAH
jgi:hypothetical protein